MFWLLYFNFLDPIHLFDYSSSVVVGYAGGSINIECIFAGYNYPQESLTIWYYNDTEITSPDSNTIITIESILLDYYYGLVNTSLMINNVAINNTGMYKCESQNCAPNCFNQEEVTVSVIINRE